ncbi:MAG: molecular chaperone SurA, partial [Legionellales bacterium]|nr:molecular chaperone SurA [Legionellales bacterium]
KKQAEKIRAQLVHGASFSQLAKAYSQDPGSASKGGSLGWVPPGVLVPPFENAMNHLKINTISQPVKTSYGWHIIEVLGRKKVDDTADYQKNEIRKMIYQRRFQEEAQNWVERMKDASYIKVYLNTNG